MQQIIFIYILKHPETNEIRYVGKTNNSKQRFKYHNNKAQKHRDHRYNWIMSLKKDGLKPTMETIKEVKIEDWKYWEKYYIKYYQGLGCNLTNICGGGEGLNFGNQTSFKPGDISLRNHSGSIPIKQIDKITKQLIRIFSSAAEAERQTGIHQDNITNAVRGISKSAGGYIWKRV